MKNGQGYQKRLGDILTLEYGKPLAKERRQSEGKYPVFGANGVKCFTSESFHTKSSIIVGRKGTAGAVNLVEGGFWPLDVTYFVTFNESQHELKYLYYLLVYVDLPKLATGVKPGINRNNVYAIECRVPRLQEQKRIVAILDEAFAGIETAIANTEKNLANAQEIFLAFLSRVFDVNRHGWKEMVVGEFAEHCLGKMLDKRKNRGVLRPYLRNVNVRWFDVDTSDLLEMKIEDTEVDRYMVQRGDLLICEGGYPGRAAIWEGEETVFFQKAVHRVRCHAAAHNRWLMYFLYLADATGYLRSYFTGAGIQHFTGKSLKRFMVPVAPPNQAAKWSAKMDELRADLGRIESAHKRKLAALTELKQSLLEKAFSGELTAGRAEREVESAAVSEI